MLAWFPLMIFAQPKISKIKHEALEINNGMAWYKGKPYTGISYTFWDNNRINEEFSWVEGLKEGLYREYTENAILVTQITWEHGAKNGPYIYYYENGAKQSEGNFKDNELDGEIIGYYPAGNKRYVNTYSRGIRHGKSLSWFGNGAPEQISNFVNDLPDGEVFAYYPDSGLRYECVYKMGVRNGRYYQFHRSGCPAEETYYKMGVMDSVHRIWNEFNCARISEEYFKDGQKSGPSLQFDANGDTLELITWQYGKKTGTYKQWTVHTEKVPVKRRVHGGDAHFYVQTRGVEIIGAYTDGQPDGYWQYGLHTHFQQREGNYEQGIMTGEWKFYDSDGKLLMRQWYDDDGNIVKEKHYRRPRK